jgi:two-component system, NarL family, sensor histidine kinase UhpB
MWTPDSLRWLKHSAALNYGAAVLSVIAALFIARWLSLQYGFEPLTLFLCAVLFSAWIGGAGPGGVALGLSLAAFQYCLLISHHPLDAQINPPRLILAVLIGIFIVALSAKQRSAAEALRESELRLRQIAENIRECIWIATPAMDQMLYVNPAYTSIWGRSVESLCQRPKSLFEAIHAEDREQATGIIRGQRQQGFDIEYRIVKPDGAVRWIREVGVPVKDESGIVYRIAGISEDITERRQIVETLRQSEFDLAEAQRLTKLGSWTLDIATGIVRWSEELYRIFDVDKATVKATYEIFVSRLHPEDRPRVLQANAKARSDGKSFEIEYRISTPSGQLKHIREIGYARKDRSDAVSAMFGTAQDITEHKQAENASRDSSIQLRALSRRLVELQECERRELSRELHDRVGQNLTALKINIDMLQPALAPRGNEDVLARVADSAALLESTMDAIENVMSELRPPMLDDHGLAAALDWHARKFSRRAGIAVVVNADELAVQPAPQVQIALFRIAQEALNNIAKHAGARHAEIALYEEDGDCVMSVRDDGIGFDVGENGSDKPKTGIGMVTMRERSQAIGGRFEVQALLERGTRLTVRVPC